MIRNGLRRLTGLARNSRPLSASSVSSPTEVNQESDHVPSPKVITSVDKDFFRINDLFTIEDLMRARVHFGHKDTMLNPHMRPYIFGNRLGVLIIDLNHTERLLKKALNVAAELAYRGGIILFVHNSRQTGYIVEDMAKECGEFAYCRKWQDTIFTNTLTTFGSVTRLPDLLVFFNTLSMPHLAHKAVRTSAKSLIPTVGVCDTNCDPTLITYPVPGNDDTLESIELYSRLFKMAILNGKERKKEIVEKYGEDYYNKTLES